MENRNDRFNKQLAFIKRIDDMKRVFRRNVNLDGVTPENDADHSWHIAVMAMTLREYTAVPTDTDKTVQLCLVHDLIEVFAGDTFCWDTEALKGKEEREAAAAEKLFSLLPPDQKEEFHSLWTEFETCQTPESRFANALDRLQPFILNVYTEGHTWRMAHTTYSQAQERFALIKTVLPSLWGFVTENLEAAMKKGYIVDDRPA